MDHVKVFLRTPLFSSTLLTSGPSILIGRVREHLGSGLIISVESNLSSKGHPVEGWDAAEIFLPMAKIDYVQLLEE